MIITRLPSLLAFSLQEYETEPHPVLKLWHACDFVELLLRLILMIGVADLLHNQGRLSDSVSRQLWDLIEQPTMGKWRAMAEIVAKALPPNQTVVPELIPFVSTTLLPLLDGLERRVNSETSFIELRNQLAHSGGVSRSSAVRLLDLWKSRLDMLIDECSWICDLSLVVPLSSGQFGELRGPSIVPAHFTEFDAAILSRVSPSTETILMIRGKTILPLWPLALFGEPRTSVFSPAEQSDAVPQVYVRRGDIRLQYTPLGSDAVSLSEGSDETLESFSRIFQLDRARTEELSKSYLVQGFDQDFRRDASQMVGREGEFAALNRLLRETPEGFIWVSGEAGIGKSFLLAKLARELAIDPMERVIVLPYRFKHGDDRCNPDSFAWFAIERLRSQGIGSDTGERNCSDQKLADRLIALLQKVQPGWRILFILDGVDEILERAPDFVMEVLLRLALPGVTLFCAGRPERGLPEIFHDAGAIQPYPEGLPRMNEGDVRTMLLEKIGHLRRKLLRSDRDIKNPDGSELVVNSFVTKVARCAAGLPIYVKYVIGDILGGRIIPDPAVVLPPSLAAYHEELMRRCSIGDMNQTLTPMVATLAVAYEPLTAEELAALLVRRSLLSAGREGIKLVRDALAGIGAMIRLAPDPDGGDSFTLFHHSLREHIRTSPGMSMAVSTAREAMARSALETTTDEATNYLRRQGPRHLIAIGRYSEAIMLLHGMHESVSGKFVLANAEAHQNITELCRSIAHCSEEEALRIQPLLLIDLLGELDEFEPILVGLKLIHQHHRKSWRSCIERILEKDNWDMHYAVSHVLSGKQKDGAEAVISELIASASYQERELGWYSFKLACLRDHSLLESPLIEKLAVDPSPMMRGILYELLLNLALEGKEVRSLVHNQAFWRPHWDYNQTQLDDIFAAMLWNNKSVQGNHAHAQVSEARDCFLETEKIRVRLLQSAEDVPLPSALTLLLDAPHKISVDLEQIQECRTAFESSPQIELFARYLLAHASWEVREAAASVFSSLPSLQPQIPKLINQYAAHSDWRLRYSAVNLAYFFRGRDAAESFLWTARKLHADAEAWVRGICAYTVTHWLRSTPPQLINDQLKAVSDMIWAMAHDSDIWALEEVRSLFEFLIHSNVNLDHAVGGTKDDRVEEVLSWVEMPEMEFYRMIDQTRGAK